MDLLAGQEGFVAGRRRGRAIEMIAHCLFHQTSPRDRARCRDCGGDLRAVGDAWYCPVCLRRREPEDCPICEGRPWL
jgi:hypothetical protein